MCKAIYKYYNKFRQIVRIKKVQVRWTIIVYKFIYSTYIYIYICKVVEESSDKERDQPKEEERRWPREGN